MYYLINRDGILYEGNTLESLQHALKYKVSMDELKDSLETGKHVVKDFYVSIRPNFKFKEVRSPFTTGQIVKTTHVSCFVDSGHEDFLNFLNIVNELTISKRYTRAN